MGVAQFFQVLFLRQISDGSVVYQKKLRRLPKTGPSSTIFCESCVHATAMCDTFLETRQFFLSCGTIHATIAQQCHIVPIRGVRKSRCACTCSIQPYLVAHHSIARVTRSTAMYNMTRLRPSRAEPAPRAFPLSEHPRCTAPPRAAHHDTPSIIHI